MSKNVQSFVAYILAALCGVTLLASVLAAAHIGIVVAWCLVNLIF